MSSNINEADARVRRIGQEIINKSQENNELVKQKGSLSDAYKKRIIDLAKKQESEKSARSLRIKEFEDELRKLYPDKRKKLERWKRLEIKAKLKIEENNLQDELKKYKSGKSDERIGIDNNYKIALKKINDKQRELKKSINELESKKQGILSEKNNTLLSEKNNTLNQLSNYDRETEKITMKLEGIANERERLMAELSKLKSELPKPRLDFFKNLISRYKEKEEELRKRKEISEKPAEEKPEIKKNIFEKLFSKKEKKEEVIEEWPVAEKKPFVLGKLIGKEEKAQELEEAKEEKKEPKQRPKSEYEELEEAIKSLDLFKKAEKAKSELGSSKQEPLIPKESKLSILKNLFKRKRPAEITIEEESKEQPKAEEKITAKSKKLEKFYKSFNKAKEAIGKGNISKAKELYTEARDQYINLEYNEKKQVYDELMNIYNRLPK